MNATFSVDGDGDSWTVYDRVSANDWPLVVRSRAANDELRAFAEAHALVRVRCECADEVLDERGMPRLGEAGYEWEEALLGRLSDADATCYEIAAVTGDGVRDLYFASNGTEALTVALAAMPVERAFTVEAPEAVEAAGAWPLLVPTRSERQLQGDHSVIMRLSESGDEGEVPRRTDFWFYGERAALEPLVAEAGAEGYVLDRWLEDEPRGVVLWREMPVTFDDFRDATPWLLALADKHGVTYDGWETFVVKPGAPEPEPATQPKPQSLLSKLFGAKKN